MGHQQAMLILWQMLHTLELRELELLAMLEFQHPKANVALPIKTGCSIGMACCSIVASLWRSHKIVVAS